eukprot:TRINITY_DN298_c0_g1_i1.p1 TRINITY_DN298_c0_g1~~TRINITY_DN298_c0_g1_i1.p1  ORF type:complete len:205 (-),score=13.44 TRINITY_DN298_c0_g1_i1:140-754(-)
MSGEQNAGYTHKCRLSLHLWRRYCSLFSFSCSSISLPIYFSQVFIVNLFRGLVNETNGCNNYSFLYDDGIGIPKEFRTDFNHNVPEDTESKPRADFSPTVSQAPAKRPTPVISHVLQAAPASKSHRNLYVSTVQSPAVSSPPPYLSQVQTPHRKVEANTIHHPYHSSQPSNLQKPQHHLQSMKNSETPSSELFEDFRVLPPPYL